MVRRVQIAAAGDMAAAAYKRGGSNYESSQVIMAAKRPDLRGESGSDGTRTRDLRRDRPAF
jgi:hypothetical protein